MYYLICFTLLLIIIINHNYISNKINILDRADNIRKLHKIDIPQVGGIYVYFGLVFFNIYNIFVIQESLIQNEIITLSVFCSLFLLLGIFDDKFNLNANFKLIIFSILIFFLIFFESNILINEVRLYFLNINFTLGNFSYFWTLICFLLFVNAFNMFDGINLQSGLYSITILFYLYLFSDNFDLLIITILIFLFGFIYLNSNSKTFLGNNGTYFISFLISFIAIYTYNAEKKIFADEIVLLMIIPGLDLIRLFFSRIKKKKHPFKADRKHIHHLLQKKYDDFQVFLILYFFTWIPIIIAKLFNIFMITIIFQIIVYFSICIHLERLSSQK